MFKHWIMRLLGWILLVACVGVMAQALTSCVASKDYVDTRIEDVKSYADARDVEVYEKQKEAVLDIVSFADPIFPGVTAAAEDVYEGKRPSPPQELPPREDEFPWETLIIAVSSALGLGVPVAVKATNVMRDTKRRQRGEALTPEEAAKKGYYTDGEPVA